MFESIEFPAPFRHCGRLMWDRYEVEAYKRRLLGLPPVERDPQVPITFVSAKQLGAELPFGRRTIGRRVKGRINGEALQAGAAAPLVLSSRSTRGGQPSPPARGELVGIFRRGHEAVTALTTRGRAAR
jgi:hypothetical protein